MARNQKSKLLKYSMSSKNKDDFDLIREHINTDKVKPLSERLQKKYYQIQRTNQLLCSGNENTLIVKTLAEELDITERYAYKLIEYAKTLYGDLQEANKEGDRYIAIEMIKKGIAKALEKGDLPTYFFGINTLIKVQGLDKTEEENFENNTPMPKVVVITNNIEVLRQKEKAKEVEYQEIEE
jgi:hypothetical protein